ncbi:MAG: hypothetical protein WCG26_11270 [Chloroflexales bacterium]
MLIEHKPEGRVTASVIGWPAITAQGNTEDEAITSLRHALTAQLRAAKVVPLELDIEPPWLQTIGIFQHDPFAHELDALIADYRDEHAAEDLRADVEDHAA